MARRRRRSRRASLGSIDLTQLAPLVVVALGAVGLWLYMKPKASTALPGQPFVPTGGVITPPQNAVPWQSAAQSIVSPIIQAVTDAIPGAPAPNGFARLRQTWQDALARVRAQ